MTARPFAVDILFAEVKADPNSATVVSYASNVRRLIDITFEEEIPVIVSGLGNPAGIVAQAHRSGVTVMSLCGNVRQARRLEASGVDVIIAQGHEAGGHTGRVGTMAPTSLSWRKLFDAGVPTNPVIPPAVPASECRLRTSLMAPHTPDQIDFAVETFAMLVKELGAI